MAEMGVQAKKTLFPPSLKWLVELPHKDVIPLLQKTTDVRCRFCDRDNDENGSC